MVSTHSSVRVSAACGLFCTLVTVLVVLLFHGVAPDDDPDGPHALPKERDPASESQDEGQVEDLGPGSLIGDSNLQSIPVGRQLDEMARDTGGSVQVTQTEEGLTDSAEQLILSYRDERTCLLRSAGFLDLRGHVWGCVIEGPGWVDICVLEEGQGMTCTKRVIHLA